MRPGTVTTVLSGWIDPAAVFALIYSEGDTFFWLDGGANATSGMSFLGSGSITASVTGPEQLRLLPSGEVVQSTVLEFLQARLPVEALGQNRAPGAAAELDTGFPLGWVGWLGYEVGQQTLAGASGSSQGTRHPDAAFIYCDRLIAFDHAKRTVSLMATVPVGDSVAAWTPELRRWRDGVIGQLAGVVDPAGAATGGEVPSPAPSVSWRSTDTEYLHLIARCQEAIVEGEAYQLCLTNSASISGAFDPVRVYAALRVTSPTHHGGFLRIGGVSLLSSSPERFLAVSTSGVIESKPIKGTRPRGATDDDDRRLRDELLASDKERAENLMIVDLMRNDIARVSEVGSVSVPVLLAVESYAQVHQLVSTVRGQLASARHPIDAVEACFPAGSMTGTPKLRATQILAELEQAPRGVYSGAFGYFGVDGSIDLAMVIRSIVLDASGATIGSGGGITALSVPHEELAEVKLKAAVLLSVLGAH